MISAEINIKTVHRNIKRLRNKLQPNVKICAVLKANAYSLGDIKIAQEIENCVDSFAVANLREAVRIRTKANTAKPILLFGICENIKTAIEHNITISVGSFMEMHKTCKEMPQNSNLRVHIKVNTGMNRFGISTPWQLKNILEIASKHPNIIIDGLYTHMSHEINNISKIDRQLKKFIPFRTMIRRTHPHAIIHAGCSGSAEYIPAQFDMVRIGKTLYGGFKDYTTALNITSQISAVQNVAKGAGIGYGSKFTAAKPMTVGIVSCGYADLGFLNFGHTSHVYVEKTPCRILGTVCMDSFMIDVTNVISPLGKAVTIIANKDGCSVMNFVNTSGISACILFCSLNFSRAEVKYIK